MPSERLFNLPNQWQTQTDPGRPNKQVIPSLSHRANLSYYMSSLLREQIPYVLSLLMLLTTAPPATVGKLLTVTRL